MPPILIGIGSCTGLANVNRPEYLKKSPSKVIAPSAMNVRMTWIASFRRESGLRPAQSIPYWCISPKLPVETTISVRPPVSSSSVAICWQISVGSRRKTCVQLGPKRIRSVLSAAAAKRTQRSLCHVSSTE